MRDIVPEKIHTIVGPNVNYVEWMMGYPTDWTKVDIKVAAGEDDSVVAEEEPIVAESVVKPAVVAPKKVIYNGMHAFMKEHVGKDIKSIAILWKALNAAEKVRYSEIARTMSYSMV
jgi:hypothetical protein